MEYSHVLSHILHGTPTCVGVPGGFGTGLTKQLQIPGEARVAWCRTSKGGRAMYYDIGDIETQGQRVQIESLHSDLAGIEGFEASGESSASLPLWLAAPLACVSKDGEPYTQIKPHAIFGVDVLNALKSDPRNVDLYSQSPVYYELALEWLSLFGGDDLQEVLVDSIKSRTAGIFERASSLAGPDQRYEAFERQTYRESLEQRQDAVRFVRSLK